MHLFIDNVVHLITVEIVFVCKLAFLMNKKMDGPIINYMNMKK